MIGLLVVGLGFAITSFPVTVSLCCCNPDWCFDGQHTQQNRTFIIPQQVDVVLAGDPNLRGGADILNDRFMFRNRITCNDWGSRQCTENSTWRLYLLWGGMLGMMVSQTIVLATSIYRYDDFQTKKAEYKFYAEQSRFEGGDQSIAKAADVSAASPSVQHSVIDLSSVETSLAHDAGGGAQSGQQGVRDDDEGAV